MYVCIHDYDACMYVYIQIYQERELIYDVLYMYIVLV